MKLTAGRPEGFRGLLPRVSATALPDGFAQTAINARLTSKDLEAWNAPGNPVTLPKTGPINSAFLVNGAWMHWNAADLASGMLNVDAAFGPVPGDATHRFYFTGSNGGPRVSNHSIAIDPSNQGGSPSGAYPYLSYTLGVPAPAAAPTAVVSLKSGATPIWTSTGGTDLGAWVVSDQSQAPTSQVTASSGIKLDFTPGENIPKAYAYRNAAYGSLLSKAVFDFSLTYGHTPSAGAFNFGVVLGGDLVGYANRVLIFQSNGGANFNVYFGTQTTWAQAPKSPTGLLGTVAQATSYTCTLTYDFTTTTQPSMTVHISPSGSPGTTTLNTVLRVAPPSGGNLGFIAYGEDFGSAVVNNISVTNAADGEEFLEDTAYVTTNLSGFFEESEPSPATSVFKIGPNTQTALTFASPAVGTANVQWQNIYRAVTTASGETVLQLVNTEGNLARIVTSYTDTKIDAALGENIPSTDWALPPADLQGIIALPNGIMAGFTGNQLCLSAQNHPHAWPVANRYTTDYPIVGLGAIDSTVVVLTTRTPYIAQGDSPGAYRMDSLEFEQGCVSKRSIVRLRGVGVVYATGTGLYAISGLSAPVNLTERFATQREWALFSPATFIAAAHQDYYFAFGTTSILFDYRDPESALTTLPIVACAVHHEGAADTLYLIPTSISKPDSALTYSTPTANGKTLYSWDTGASLGYKWRGRKEELPYPTEFQVAQVRASDYDDVRLRLYADGVKYFDQLVASVTEFPLPGPTGGPARMHEIEVLGLSSVSNVQVAERVEDLE